jgi:glycosyltransferase involved in cell wall biosynthesis
MKVLYLIDTLETGGAEKSIFAITSRLTNFKPVIVVLYKGLALLPEFERVGLRVISCDLPGPYNLRMAARMFTRILKEEKPDVVHATLFRSEVVARYCLRNASIPLVGSFVNDSYSEERYKQLNAVSAFKLDVIKWADRFTSGWTTHYMSITKAIVASNAKALHIDSMKVTVIYRGRNVAEQYVISEAERQKFKQTYGGSFTFLSVARLLLRKGFKESIEAFSIVAKENPEARYLIAGEGHDRRTFEETIAQLGLTDKVFLLGTRQDVSALLAYADAFVFPSHYEGQGGALVEAMLAAKPIIGSDIEVVAESITNHHSGLLFRLRDSNDLADKMKWIMSHPTEAKQLGLNARAEAVKRFDADEVARQHEALYEKVIKDFKNRN